MGVLKKIRGARVHCSQLNGEYCQGCIDSRILETVIEKSNWTVAALRRHVHAVKEQICVDIGVNSVPNVGVQDLFFNACTMLEIIVAELVLQDIISTNGFGVETKCEQSRAR